MKKYSVLLAVVIAYFIGIYSGMSIKSVDATVKVPPENSIAQKNTPKTNAATPKEKVKEAPKETVKDTANTQKPITTSQKAITESKNLNAEKGMLDTSKQSKPTTTAKSLKPNDHKSTIPQGATIYNVSTSMLSDIDRLENDLAVLKNKVNIINNIRK